MSISIRAWIHWLPGVLLALSCLLTQAQEATLSPTLKAADYVWLQAGDVPIIISAPHGGGLVVKDIEPRSGAGLAEGPSGFFAIQDTGTEELARELAEAVTRRFGKQPYYVVSRLHRKYLDPNRPPKIAYDNPAIQPVYDLYHASLAQYCRDVTNRFHSGVLVDLHAQGSSRDTVYRGTKNGKTVKHLRENYGTAAHNGPQSLFGKLQTAGWRVFPDMLTDESQPTADEKSGYTGGFIVQTYGSHQTQPIDAMQLEFGMDYLTKAARPNTAKVLTEALHDYARMYLKMEAEESGTKPVEKE